MRWWRSIAFRQAFIYGALVMFTMFVLLAVFYQETVGVWDRRVDRQIDATTRKLVNYGGQKGNAALAAHITELLGDGIELLLFLSQLLRIGSIRGREQLVPLLNQAAQPVEQRFAQVLAGVAEVSRGIRLVG